VPNPTTSPNPLRTYGPPPGATPATLPFFEVGVAKFVAMSLVTFGIYDLYWAYQQWTRIKTRTGENLSPFWRAVFGPLWGSSLLTQLQKDASTHGINATWSAVPLGILYLAINITWRLPDPWWLISLLAFLPLVPAVRTIASTHDRLMPSRDKNVLFSGANWAGLVIGGLLLVLTIIGTFLPEPAP
jgi:hypothetical protein